LPEQRDSHELRSVRELETSRALTEQVLAIARSLGIEVVGVGEVREALPPGFNHLRVGVSLGVPHPGVRWLRGRDSIPALETAETVLSDHRDHHGQRRLEVALRELAAYLRSEGYRYFCCPPEVDPMESPFTARMVRRFSHKAAATCAGLGWVGRHGLLNHLEFGPHVSWATVVTDAPLVTSAPLVAGECGDCCQCVAACPSGAVSGREWRRRDGMRSVVDAARCREQLDRNEALTGRRVCGRCAAACALAKLTRDRTLERITGP
jgi:epoxyqueuosine reductase